MDCKYGGSPYDLFPGHWINGTSIEIKSYLAFPHQMIHSTNSSATEDYWYANETCQTFDEQTYPCEEIYFKKDTDIPLPSTLVRGQGWQFVQVWFTTQNN